MIRFASSSDCSSIVRLHERCLPYSLNSKIGTKHLEKLYVSLLGTKDSYVFISDENGEINGFISGFMNYGEVLRKTRSTLRLSIVLKITKVFFIKPSVILDVLDTIWITTIIRRKASKYPMGYISTWGVAPESQGSTIGLQLFGQITKYLKDSDSKRVVIDVRRSNQRVYEFYSRTGYNKIGITLLSVVMERIY